MWEVHDVVKWLSNLRSLDNKGVLVPMSDCPSKNSKSIAQVFKEHNINGTTLLDLTREDLTMIGIGFGDATEILSEIQFLKQNLRFDENVAKILKKMEKAQQTEGLSGSNSQFNSALYQEYKYLRKYLISGKLFMDHFFKELPNDVVKDFKIKFVLTEVLSEIDSNAYSTFRTALVLGPWYLEWNNHALCIPRTVNLLKPVFSCDVDFQSEIFDPNCGVEKKRIQIEAILSILSHFIVRTNINTESEMDISTVGGGYSDFVGKLLEEINARFDFEKQVHIALNNIDQIFEFESSNFHKYYPSIKDQIVQFRLLNRSKLNPQYYLEDDSLAAMFGQDNIIRFQSHVQLDLFAKYLFELLMKQGHSKEQINQLYSTEIELLKTYDRVFWLRYYVSKCIIGKWTTSSKSISESMIEVEEATNNLNRQLETMTESMSNLMLGMQRADFVAINQQKQAKVQIESGAYELEKQKRLISERSRWAPFERISAECFFGNPLSSNSMVIEKYCIELEKKERQERDAFAAVRK